MPGLKDVKDKIEGVSKTSQITQPMNMVPRRIPGAQEKMEVLPSLFGKIPEPMPILSGGIEKPGILPLMEVARNSKECANCWWSPQIVDFPAVSMPNILSTATKLPAQYEEEGKTVPM